MAKITRVELSNRLGRAVSISASKRKLVKVGLPPEGDLSRIVVRQVPSADGGGTAVAFTVDIVERYSNIGITWDNSLETSDALPADIDNIRVCPQKSGTAGNTSRDDTTGETGYSYRNGEGTHSVPVRELYLIISPTAAATTTLWDITVVAETTYGA